MIIIVTIMIINLRESNLVETEPRLSLHEINHLSSKRHESVN